MNAVQRVSGSVLLTAILTFGVYGVVVNALEGEPQYVQDDVYIEECGACHLAYAPDLLPVESWHKVMAGLEDHFGDNAELDEETAAHIGAYLEANGLSRGRSSKMSRLLRGLPADPPLRITELPAFENLHYMIPKELEVAELEEGFLSPCADCHKEAALGIYDAERLHPGYGPGVWDGKPPESESR
ncbi:MAG: hypothetical protein AB7I04_08650 [Pseudomonadales bacterium]